MFDFMAFFQNNFVPTFFVLRIYFKTKISKGNFEITDKLEISEGNFVEFLKKN